MKRKFWHISIPLVLILLIILAGFTIKNKNNNSTFAEIVGGVEKFSGLNKWEPSGTLVYKNGEKIYYYSLDSGQEENYPLTSQTISNSISDSGTLLLGQPEDKWNKGKNIEDISSLNLSKDAIPAISPDGEKVAYLSFSNAEKDYGYNIYTSGKNGTKSIFHSEDQIQFLCWCDNDTVLFVLKQQSNQITSLNIGSSAQTTIASVDENITSLAARGDVVVATIDKSKKNLIVINRNNKKKSIKNIDANYNNTSISPDEKAVAYLNSDSKISIYNLSDGNKKQLSKADKIIGWYK